MSWLRTAPWVCLSLAVAVFGVWAVLGPWRPAHNAAFFLTTLVFVGQPIGALWMLCHCIRYEDRPLPFVFLAFMPYAFLWYYRRRVRKAAGRVESA